MAVSAAPTRLFADHALLAGGWARQVELTLRQGRIAAIRTGAPPSPDAEQAGGLLLPAMSNLHSHAFQRAMAGFAEGGGPDDFWSWRRQMYALVAQLDPDQAQAIAEQAYVEMLKAGFCAVGEFHYLHHRPDGRPYAALTELAERMIAAARRTGIAITLLPVLYAHGGFGALPPEPEQRRFVNDIGRYRQLLETLLRRYPGTGAEEPGVRIGAAFHSLRAVSPSLLLQGLAVIDSLDRRAPVHIHIAEQRREVRDCLRWCGRRPVAWLLEQLPVDRRWCLVHATHINRQEIQALAASRAVAGLCPLTEADLGDGIFPGAAYLNGAVAGRFGIGSDSQIRIDMAEALRWLEYGQRLARRRRAVLATAASPSVGRTLYCGAASGGAQALGLASGALQTGARADLLVLDLTHPGLASGSGDHWLDAWIFACTPSPIRHVMVAGRWQIRDGHHPDEEVIAARFRQVQKQLRQG